MPLHLAKWPGYVGKEGKARAVWQLVEEYQQEHPLVGDLHEFPPGWEGGVAPHDLFELDKLSPTDWRAGVKTMRENDEWMVDGEVMEDEVVGEDEDEVRIHVVLLLVRGVRTLPHVAQQHRAPEATVD